MSCLRIGISAQLPRILDRRRLSGQLVFARKHHRASAVIGNDLADLTDPALPRIVHDHYCHYRERLKNEKDLDPSIRSDRS